MTWSDGIRHVTLGPQVPSVIILLALRAAGSHRAEAIVPELIAAKDAGWDIQDVVWDRGYSQLRPETTSHPLNRAGIHQTFLPKGSQRLPRPFSTDALIIEGQLFSAHLPDELRGPLPMPPQGASEEVRAEFERDFNRRALFRLQRHAGPDADGSTRWRCSFEAGFLRSRSLPKTIRRSRNAPLVDLAPGSRCCDGIKTVSAEELPLWQRLSPGTSAWRKSMGRREVVEGANGGLKGNFVNIDRKAIRVFGRVKIQILLTFTVAGYNRDAIRSFLAKAAATRRGDGRPQARTRRRRGTWSDLLDKPGPASERGPPTG